MILCAVSIFAALLTSGCPDPDLPDLAGATPRLPATAPTAAPGGGAAGEGAAPASSPDPSSSVGDGESPADDDTYVGPCTASWYGEQHRGLTTASGEPFDPDAMTAAAWDYPFGTTLEVVYQGTTVEVVVTDRGPAHRLGRCLDLSEAAFAVLAPTGAGLIDVEYRKVDR